MGSTIFSIIAIGALIVFHEMGHYFVARWSGMRVSKFSVGFGPPLAKVKKGETEYQISLIPLGGFVQIDGMNPHDGTDPNSPRSYSNRPMHQRLATIFAGPAANYLLGFVMLFLFYAFFMTEALAPVRVVRVASDTPAERAGLKQGDLIVGTASAAFERVEELRETVQREGERGVALRVRRAEGGAEELVRLVPAKVGAGYQIGIELEGTEFRTRPMGVSAGLEAAWSGVVRNTVGTLQLMGQLIQFKGGGQVSGPIGIVKGVSRAAERSWAEAFGNLAFISIALGIFNLLPIPALDGSRLLFLLLGVIRRKPLNPRIETYVHVGGFLLLAALMVVISFSDLMR